MDVNYPGTPLDDPCPEDAKVSESSMTRHDVPEGTGADLGLAFCPSAVGVRCKPADNRLRKPGRTFCKTYAHALPVQQGKFVLVFAVYVLCLYLSLCLSLSLPRT